MSTNTKRRAPAAVDRHGGAVRVGQLMALPGLLHEMGVPPRRAFDRAGVRPRAFADAENFISYEEAGRLLAGCVHLTGWRISPCWSAGAPSLPISACWASRCGMPPRSARH